MSTSIRPARLDDAAGLATLQTLVWREAYAGLLSDAFLARLDVSAEMWRQRLTEENAGSAAFVAERDRRIIGFATGGTVLPGLPEEEATVGHLYAIYVLAECYGRGVGYRLHEAVTSYLAAEGFASAVLWVLAGNQRAINFYVRQGWVADGGSQEEVIDGQRLPELRYRLSRLGR